MLWFYGAKIRNFSTNVASDKKAKTQWGAAIDSNYKTTYDIWASQTTWLLHLQDSFHVRKQGQVKAVHSKSESHTKTNNPMQFYLLKESCFPKLIIFYKIKWCSIFSVNIKLIIFKKSCWCTISLCDDIFFQYELFVGKRAINTNYSSCSYFLNLICPHQYVVLKSNNCSNTGEWWKPIFNMDFLFLSMLFLVPWRKGRTNGLWSKVGLSLHFKKESKCLKDLVFITGLKSTVFSVFVYLYLYPGG